MSPAKHAFSQVKPHNRVPKQSLSCGTQDWATASTGQHRLEWQPHRMGAYVHTPSPVGRYAALTSFRSGRYWLIRHAWREHT